MELLSNEVVHILRQEYDPWIKELSNEEYRALRKYTYNSFDSKFNRFYRRLNSALRGDYNRSDKEMLLRYADIISGAILRHPLQHDIVCYRRLDVDPIFGIEIGTVFSYDQFISTSVLRNRTLKGAYENILHVPCGAYGAYIERLSAYSFQKEFLLDVSCEYRILSRQDRVTEMEVVL